MVARAQASLTLMLAAQAGRLAALISSAAAKIPSLFSPQ